MHRVDMKSINWDHFFRLVERHQLYPTVYHNFKKHMPAVEKEPVLSRLHLGFERNRVRSASLMSCLVNMSRDLKDQGIPLVSLKGPLLSLKLYGNFFFRQYNDLDVLVREKDMARVHKWLINAGYHTILKDIFENPWATRAHLFLKSQLVYKNPPLKRRVEIHHRLLANPLFLPLKKELLWEQVVEENIANTSFLSLPDNVYLLYLLAHGAVHRWYRLKWLLDVVSYSQKVVCSEEFWRLLEKCQLERVLCQADGLTRYFFGKHLLPIPDSIKIKSRQIEALTLPIISRTEQSLRQYTNNGSWDSVKGIVQRGRLKPGLTFKLLNFRSIFFIEGIHNSLRLPGILIVFYLPLYPFFWVYKKYFTPWFRGRGFRKKGVNQN